MKLSLLVAALAILAAGCAVEPQAAEEMGDTSDSVTRGKTGGPSLGDALDRVALGRMYQQDQWMVRGKDAAYVGAQMAALRPTYVSGLVRLARSSDLGKHPEIVTAWKTVRAAVPAAKLDFVLNICDYATAAQLTAKMDEVNAALGGAKPEIWFFDFWDRPLVEKDGENRACDASSSVIQAGITYAHAQGQLIGGNVWSDNVPDRSDFLAVPDEKGLAKTLDVVAKVRKARPDMPLMVHIENNPQKGDDPGNDGLAFVKAGATAQKAYLRDFAGAQKKAEYTYMFPVFFPLVGTGDTAYSFDAAAILPFEKTLID